MLKTVLLRILMVDKTSSKVLLSKRRICQVCAHSPAYRKVPNERDVVGPRCGLCFPTRHPDGDRKKTGVPQGPNLDRYERGRRNLDNSESLSIVRGQSKSTKHLSE